MRSKWTTFVIWCLIHFYDKEKKGSPTSTDHWLMVVYPSCFDCTMKHTTSSLPWKCKIPFFNQIIQIFSDSSTFDLPNNKYKIVIPATISHHIFPHYPKCSYIIPWCSALRNLVVLHSQTFHPSHGWWIHLLLPLFSNPDSHPNLICSHMFRYFHKFPMGFLCIVTIKSNFHRFSSYFPISSHMFPYFLVISHMFGYVPISSHLCIVTFIQYIPIFS